MQKVLLHEFKSIISIPYFPNFLSLFLTHTPSLSLSLIMPIYIIPGKKSASWQLVAVGKG